MRRGLTRTWLIVISAVALIAGGAVVWRKVIRDHVVPRNFGVVEPGRLYRSGRLTESTLRGLSDKYQIKTVVDLGAYDLDPERERAMQQCAAGLGISRHSFNLKGDGTGDPNIYVQALQLMSDPANEPILVMCNAGAQRTGAAVLLYRHIIEGRDFQNCYAESFDYRHDPGKDWVMLAYVADWAPMIEAAYRQGETVEQAQQRLGALQATDSLPHVLNEQ
jgi:protein tyrosine/serine phosphatase